MGNLNKHFKFVLLSILTLGCGALYAQQVTVSGIIMDGVTNEPLLGAIVIVEGTSTGSMVGQDGKFSFKATPEQTLVFSHSGYRTQRMTASEVLQNPVIVLVEDIQEIEDVVIVGYGVQKKASSVAAITQIDGSELLVGGAVGSVGEAFQGKLNGVLAINKNGQPGNNNVELLIRGKNSWNPNTPLVLVDGVIRDFNDVDLHEIQSVSVLKDASATAVFGVRGANGVILLTTKRGLDPTPRVNVSSSVGFRQLTRSLEWGDYMTAMKLWNEAQANDGVWSLIPESTITAWQHAFDTGNYGPYNDVFPQVNWYDAIMKDFAVSQNYNVNVSGSTDHMRYFASVGFQRDGDNYNIEKQSNFDPRYYYNRYNWRSNFDFDLTKSTRLSVNISGNMGYRNSFNNRYSERNIILQTVQAATNEFPIRYSDGEWGDNNSEINNILAAYSSRGQRRWKTLRNWYDLKFTQKLDFVTKGLSFSAQYSYNTSTSTESTITPGLVLGQGDIAARDRVVVRYQRIYDFSNPIIDEFGNITYNEINRIRYQDGDQADSYPVAVNYDALTGYSRRHYYEFALNYARSFGGHNVTALALMNRQIVDSKAGGMLMDYPSYLEDWVGRITYNYKERYLLEMNMSYTGSDKFSPENRFGFFPSFSVGWRLSEEPFMANAKRWLTNFKARYSWGQVGSDALPGGLASPYLYMSTFTQTDQSLQLGGSTNVNAPAIINEGGAPNPTAGWETGTKQNLGIEMSFWNKLDINVDLYDEKRDGILMPVKTMAFWFGTTYPILNIGKTKNHGVEFEVRWRDKIGSDFKYFVGFGFAASENRVVFRDDPNDPIENPEYMKEAGKPIDWQKRLLATGNFNSIDDVFNHATSHLISADSKSKVIPGDLVYMDFNGDGIIDAKDRVPTDQLNYPQATYSLNLGFEWKGIGLSALLYSPQGIYRNVFDYFYLDFPTGMTKVQPDALDRWTYATAGQDKVQRPSVHLDGQANNGHNLYESTFRYRNYAYIRLKNLELSYTLPKKWVSNVNMRNVRVYVAGNNLFTITDVDKRLDPETSAQDQYPISKNYTVGLNFSF